MARADKFTLTQKKKVIYSDFLTNFDQNPHTGYLGRVTNEAAVAQAYRNLLLTNKGERFYESDKGSDITSTLFELYDPTMSGTIELEITSYLNRYEPRGNVSSVVIEPDQVDFNAINMKIVYTTKNDQNQLRTLNIHIQRVR
jgi:phage baseplate assembly protein W